MSDLETEWRAWTENGLPEEMGHLTEVSVDQKQVVFELDGVEFTIMAYDEAMDQPWRFEMVPAWADDTQESEIDQLHQSWLNDVNEDFQGKLNEDPPREFFAIMAQHYLAIFSKEAAQDGFEDEGEGEDDLWM